MNAWNGISEVLQQLTGMGVAFGIVGFFIYREWLRRKEQIAMMERMTPEQLADIRRVDAQIEAERKRGSAGNLWFLRVGMSVLGGGGGLLLGLNVFPYSRELHDIFTFEVIAATVAGIGLFIFLEFLIELWLHRMEVAAESNARKSR